MILATMTEYPLDPSSMAAISMIITLATGIVGYVAGWYGGRQHQLERDIEQLERELIHKREDDSDER